MVEPKRSNSGSSLGNYYTGSFCSDVWVPEETIMIIHHDNPEFHVEHSRCRSVFLDASYKVFSSKTSQSGSQMLLFRFCGMQLAASSSKVCCIMVLL